MCPRSRRARWLGRGAEAALRLLLTGALPIFLLGSSAPAELCLPSITGVGQVGQLARPLFQIGTLGMERKA